jgi:hypothetical protein
MNRPASTLAFVLSASLLLGATAHAAGFGSAPDGKAGRLMFNLKVGPAFAAYDDFYATSTNTPLPVTCSSFPYECPDSGLGITGTLMLDFGLAVTPDRNGYLLFPLQFQIAKAGSFVMIPIGFQYDIPLPVRGLYLTPRLSVGYAAYVVRGHRVADLGAFVPEFGAKYVIARRWNVGLDAFSLPIYFGDFTAVSYRLLLYGGVNF